MREIYIGTRNELSEDGNDFHFAYYVLVGEMTVASEFSCESYGVKIVNEERPDEAVSIPDITVDASRIDELMELLTRNSVTPIGLRDVVSDWL